MLSGLGLLRRSRGLVLLNMFCLLCYYVLVEVVLFLFGRVWSNLGGIV